MSDESLRLGLFGVLHMDDPDKVTAELRSFVQDGEAEALFVEMPDGMPGARELLVSFLRAPFYFFGLCVLFLFVQGPLLLYYNGEPRPTERIAIQRLLDEAEMPVHGVDPTLVSITDVGLPTTAANWLLFAFLVWASPAPVVLTVAGVVGWFTAMNVALLVQRLRLANAAVIAAPFAAVAATLLGALIVPVMLLFGYVACQVALFQTMDTRNDRMLTRTADLAADESYDTAVLVTGRDHLRGMASLADERGIAVPAVHISEQNETGRRLTDFTPADLPALRDGDDGYQTDQRSQPRPRRADGRAGASGGQARADAGRRSGAPSEDGRPPAGERRRRGRDGGS
jgi:xanthosine utilization system XapX-like protein